MGNSQKMKAKVLISAIIVLVLLGLFWFWAKALDNKAVLTPVERCIKEGTRPDVCACINLKMQKEITTEKVNAFRKELKNNNFSSDQILQLFSKIKKECLK